jgi:hypothetical protein
MGVVTDETKVDNLVSQLVDKKVKKAIKKERKIRLAYNFCNPKEIFKYILDRVKRKTNKKAEIEITNKQKKQFMKKITNEVNKLLEKLENDFFEINKFVVGGDFSEDKIIKEFENDDYFIPSSFYCLIKCIEKYLGVRIAKDSVEPIGMSINKFKSVLEKEKIKINDCPSIFYFNERELKMEKIEPFVNNKRAAIFLFRIKRNLYHSVLIKNKGKVDLDDYKNIIEKIDYEKTYELRNETLKIEKPAIKNRDKYFYVYDIETSALEIDGELVKLVPEGIALMKVDEKKDCERDDVVTFIGNDCFEKMFDYLSENEPNRVIKIFAHNGGRFDNLYVKNMKNIKIKQQIKVSGIIKKLVVLYNKKEFVFLDSFSFLQASLKMSCQYFQTEKKEEFDIACKSHEWFENNRKWIKYMKNDAFVLGQIMKKFESYLNQFGESVTTNTGIASISWNILTKTCYSLNMAYILKCPVTKMFIRNSCYGGRVLHYRNRFIANVTKIRGKTSKGLVSLDGNSLYPSAMYIGEYPIGRPIIFPEEKLCVGIIKLLIEKGFLFIAEVEIDGMNIRYPLLPYRNEKGIIMYKSGLFSGVYNSIDLEEALNDGYKIKKVKKLIFWENKTRMFKNLIKNFYEKRKELKKEKNPMEYVLKIALNSMYGKFLETIKTCYKYNENSLNPLDEIKEISKLPNGQYEFKVDHIIKINKKPIQIASFILSYARKIMNNLIRKVGPENIFYSDTDSIYCTIESAKGIELNNDLCGFKNDYGENAVIKEAYFLDVKRYLVIFSKPVENRKFKAKFNGLNFVNILQTKDYATNEDCELEKIRNIYETLYNNPGKEMTIIQNRWIRKMNSVFINQKEMEYYINPEERGKWVYGKWYPIDYIFDDKRKMLGPITKFENTNKTPSDFCLINNNIYSALPLVYEKLNKDFICRPVKKLEKLTINSTHSNYVIDENKQIYYRRLKKKKNGYFFEVYEINEYGPIRKLKEKETPKKLFYLYVMKDGNNIFPRITKEEYEKIKDFFKL